MYVLQSQSIYFQFILNFSFPRLLTHLFVVEAVVCIFVRVLVQYEVSKPPQSLFFHPLPRIQIILLRRMLLHKCLQSQNSSLHWEAL